MNWLLPILLLASPALAQFPYQIGDEPTMENFEFLLEEIGRVDNNTKLSTDKTFGGNVTIEGNLTVEGGISGFFDLGFSSGSANITEAAGVWTTVTGSSITITVDEGSRLKTSWSGTFSHTGNTRLCHVRLMRGNTPASPLATNGDAMAEFNQNEEYVIPFYFVTEQLSAGTTTFSVMFKRDSSDACTLLGNPPWHHILEEIKQ